VNDNAAMDRDIASRQNPRVKHLVKLRDQRQRTGDRLTVVDGAREIARAAAAGIELTEAYCCPEAAQSVESQQAWNALAGCCPVRLTVTAEVYEKIRYGQRCDGLVAVARVPQRTLAGLRGRLGPRPLIGVLEGVQKPGNLGAVLRSADGAGVDAVVAADGQTDLFNPHAIRASMGVVFKPNAVAASLAETLAWLADLQLPVVAARVDAELDYDAFDFRRGAAIVLGGEATGLSAAWHAAAVTPVRLPMLGMADSLNVAAAAAVLFYEARRQQRRSA